MSGAEYRMKDYHGDEIPDNETPDTEITVWTISPSIDQSYDCLTGRDYHDALEYAKSLVEHLMDDPDQEFPVTITIDQERTTVGDFEEMVE